MVKEALCHVDKVGSAAKPNCNINFVVVASVVVFSCQEPCVVSDLICFARAMLFFLFFGLVLLLCSMAHPGFRIFGLLDLCCLGKSFLGNCFVGSKVAFGRICFSSRRLVCHLLVVGPSSPCFLLVLRWRLCVLAFCICPQGERSSGPAYRTLFANKIFEFFKVRSALSVEFHRCVLHSSSHDYLVE